MKKINEKLSEYKHQLLSLLEHIKTLEANSQLDVNIKLLKIKKIRDEINKVGQEIDTVKKEIMLLNAYQVN